MWDGYAAHTAHLGAGEISPSPTPPPMGAGGYRGRPLALQTTNHEPRTTNHAPRTTRHEPRAPRGQLGAKGGDKRGIRTGQPGDRSGINQGITGAVSRRCGQPAPPVENARAFSTNRPQATALL